jgi:hypothetical protein
MTKPKKHAGFGLGLLVQCRLGFRAVGESLTQVIPGCLFPAFRQTLVAQLKALKGKAEQQQLKAQTAKEMQILSQEEVRGFSVPNMDAPEEFGPQTWGS